MSNSHFVQEFFIYIGAIFDAFPNYEYRNVGLLFFSEKSSGSNFEYCNLKIPTTFDYIEIVN